jgi:peptide/nickel transport system permease protein
MERSFEEVKRDMDELVSIQRRLAISRFLSNKTMVFGVAFILLMSVLVALGPYFIDVDPYEMSVSNRLNAPSAENILGTDEFGRDLFTRVIYGGRISFMVGSSVMLISSTMGLVIGLYASYYRRLDGIFMRICDGMMAIPGVLLAIALMAALGPSVKNVIIALSIVYTPSTARIVRSQALVVKEQTYIEAIRSQGAGANRIIWGHIAINVMSPLIVQATYVFAESIISEAALSFLGAGIPAPMPSWGNIVQSGKSVISKAWWVIMSPSLLIVLTVLSLNLVGDGIRDFMDPKLILKSRKKER